ncbi:CopG family ribbon-helix-helix protein [Roseibium aggregatum]|nr:ribbon-helix-helix domain-containing protein [Roseibium aggregatum]
MENERTQVSLRLPSEMVADFDKIAAGLDRDRSWVMQRAFKFYLEQEGREIIDDLDGIAALDRGEGVDFDDVLDQADDIIATARTKPIRQRA